MAQFGQRVTPSGMQFKRGLHAADVVLHEFFSQYQVALFQRLHNQNMLVA